MSDFQKPEGYDAFLSSSPIQKAGLQKPEGYAEFIAPEVKEEKYGSPIELAKTALEGAASASTLGASSGLERLLLGNKDEQLARAEVNPITHATGAIAGLVAPALLTGGATTGVAGAMEAVGAGGARALGLGLKGAGLVSRLGHAAVKGAIEGGIFQGGDEISKMLLSDPEQTSNTALANIGFAAALGAPIGAFTSGAGELWNAKFV